MEKVDLKKNLKPLYAPKPGKFVDVDVPPLQYLMIDGEGSPGEAPAYARAVEWLYSVSYPIKFHSKNELGRDYTVMPLEGIWWADDMTAYTTGDREQWKWTMMILQPEWISADMLALFMEKAQGKLGDPPETIRLETIEEGRSLQTLHLGPFADEGPVLAHLHNALMPKLGLTFNGNHHEIYLSDPRRVAPEKLKTILRQPVMEL